MSALKLDSLSISGFRAFEHLAIDRLGRVNLIVGKNNVGKTCLLEALRLYAHRGSPSVILDMLYTREEYNRRDQMDNEDHLKTISYLFHGWKTEQPPNTLSIGLAHDPLDLLKITVGWYEEELDPESKRRSYRPAIRAQVSFLEGKSVDDYFPGINIVFGSEAILTVLLDQIFGERTIFRYPWRPSIKEIPCVFVSADGLNRRTATNFWDEIALRAGEERVIEGLRIITPEVERINLLGRSETGTARVPIVRIRGVEEPVPLRTLGEGMNSIFELVLAAINAQKGILLVDEISSGLHYTVLKDLWAMLFQIATRLDIQIFATTHSWDCIEGFQEAAAEDEAVDIALIRLERRKGHIVPILFDRDRLSIATRQEIEIR